MSDDEYRRTAGRLLQRRGLEDFEMQPIPGGRNNRVWHVRTAEGHFLFKKYYWTEGDQRDRMGHEWDFLTYLREIGCQRAAAPCEADRDARCALLEFLEGRPLRLQDVTDADISTAADFFSEMNAGRFSPAGQALPAASEACFSLREHLDTAQHRVDRLEGIPELHRDAHAFVAAELRPLWHDVQRHILRSVSAAGALEAKLDPGERCLSPSDFGFHNALRMADGALRFVDFEYAGWDDPAKTIADFANQPDMLLDNRRSGIFLERALALFPDDGRLAARLRWLTPLYQVKWACICLNEFLAGGAERRAFTGKETADVVAHLSAHLSRARVMAGRAVESLDAAMRAM